MMLSNCSVFDNGAADLWVTSTRYRLASRGLLFKLDFTTMTAKLVTEYHHASLGLATSQGSIRVRYPHAT